MNCKILMLCAVLAGFAICTAEASAPVTYKEIAMLLRNGEEQQFIMDEAARRKLLQPLTQEEQADLISLGATPALMKALQSPATAGNAAAYTEAVQQQKADLQRQQQEEQLAAQAAADARTRRELQGLEGSNPPVNEYAGKTIDLQFTAADGTPVNLASLRGKVVLVDFWATWCKPCMGEVPNVVAAYKKYHDKGFEVIGISLDQSKERMFAVTQEKEMTWPQYFDGLVWHNEIAVRFNVRSIPTMWLINKKGIVAITNARADLDGEIAKLLTE